MLKKTMYKSIMNGYYVELLESATGVGSLGTRLSGGADCLKGIETCLSSFHH